MLETWKPIKGYEGLYDVSDLGNVKSLERDTKNQFGSERILKFSLNGVGYLTVCLYRKGSKRTRTIHQLVAVNFLNHTPNGHELVINHINLIKTDNRAVNLEIVTSRENSNMKHLNSTSKYVGVYWLKKNKKWRAQIRIKGKLKELGCFVNELDASEAYQKELNNLKQ